MPETSKPTRLKAWVRALRDKEWRGEAGQRFRATLGKIVRLGRDNLKLDEKASATYDALWARAEGQIIGKDQADALQKWQEAENKRIEARLKTETFDDAVARESAQTEKLKAETEKVRAEAVKTQAEAAKLKAEEERIRAETARIKIDAAIVLADRLADAKVWVVRDRNGGLHLVRLPKDADLSPLFEDIIGKEALDSLSPADDEWPNPGDKQDG